MTHIYSVKTSSYPPVSPGTKVTTFIDGGMEADDWNEEAKKTRRHEASGVVTGHHDSHGLCFVVRHDDGNSSCYELHELIVVAFGN